MFIFFTRTYRRFYLWTHKTHRNTMELIRFLKSIIKILKTLNGASKNLLLEFEHIENVQTRKVLIEKYTKKNFDKEQLEKKITLKMNEYE